MDDPTDSTPQPDGSTPAQHADADEEEDDFGLPEPPSMHHPPPVAPPLPPMRAGSRVLYLDPAAAQPVRGTVARVDGDMLHVALADRIVTASRTHLVFELQADDDACYYHSGGVETCSIEAADVQHWCGRACGRNTRPWCAQAALLHGAPEERERTGRVGRAAGACRAQFARGGCRP